MTILLAKNGLTSDMTADDDVKVLERILKRSNWARRDLDDIVEEFEK